MAFVELDRLTKRYGSTTVVNEVDLAIDKGTLVCLLGPSGCGKTTTLRLIAGFVQPSDGHIRVGGRVVSSPSGSAPPEARNMSMIFQSYALWPHMTVFENVAYGLRLRHMAKSDIESKARRILQATKLENLAERYPALLRGRSPILRQGEANGRPVWRLRTGGFANGAEASAFCDRLRGAGLSCWVARSI